MATALEIKQFKLMLAEHGLRTTSDLDDIFRATSAVETFRGGAGNDTVSYDQSTSGVQVSLFQTNVNGLTGFGGFAASDRFSGIENVVGSNHADRLEGDAGSNTLVGLGGNDVIIGSNGDKLYGDGGTDNLQGYVFNGGSIYMNGGADADTLIFTTNGGNATIATGTGLDKVTVAIGNSQNFHVTITDFQPYFEAFGSIITATEAARGDQIKVLFANNGESLLQRSASHTEIRGNDVAMVFDNPGVNGEIVFQNIGSYINLDSFEFRVDLGFMDLPLAV